MDASVPETVPGGEVDSSVINTGSIIIMTLLRGAKFPVALRCDAAFKPGISVSNGVRV